MKGQDMTRRRRVFEIDMPDEPESVEHGGLDTQRRSPMASAIAENADALRERKAAIDSIRIENDALAHELVALKEAGHVVQSLPVDDVHTDMLVRDRLPGEDVELAELVASIQDLGLSNPIRVLERPDDAGFELVQGYRRLGAYRRLHQETGDAQWASIPALIMKGGDDIGGLYRRMVDENVVRKDLSFAEMAHAAQAYAADPATGVTDLSDAVAALFQSAPYSKRSYIRSFAALLDALGDALRYPTEIPRALGVAVARALKENPEWASKIQAELKALDAPEAEAELAVLKSYAIDQTENPGVSKKQKRGAQKGRTKTTFHIKSSAGQVKCTAAQGRLEIKVDRDFSAIDRARLEKAIASLVDGLG